MKRGLIVLAVIVVLVAAVVGPVVGSYNKLVRINEDVKAAWSQVDTQLQRRYDLIPNLVETAKGFASHETAVFTAVSDARAKLAGARTGTVDQRAAAEAEMSGALQRLLALVENYPQLKSDAHFKALMDELAGTENRIAVARMRYNETVQSYNQTLKQFPMVLFARAFGFAEKPYFQPESGAQQAPKVQF